jgi:signal recognition particle subunit SRP54
MLTKIVHTELIELMGATATDITLKGSPAVVLVAGLQGSGKTTFCGKLAALLRKQGRSPMLAACDVYRPAAIEQLKIVGETVGCPVYTEESNPAPIQIAKNAVAAASARNCNVVIIDTAGRLAIDEPMMKEVEAIKRAVRPSETLFVVDAMTGQDAVNTAKEFNERLDFDGVVLTKLDGDTRGGAALSIRAVVNKPIKFMSVGEKPVAVQVFHPDRMADRILGMGDVVSLVEKAQEQFDSEEGRRLAKRMAHNQFDYEDFAKQIRQFKKMGSVKDLLAMLPDTKKIMDKVNVDDNMFQRMEAIIGSMTPYERRNPDAMNNSRRKRLALGSGCTTDDVNRFLKQFDAMRKQMKGGKGLTNAMGLLQR